MSNDELPTGLKIPKTLAGCADLLYKRRNERLAMQKEVDALRSHESYLENYIIDNLPKSQAEGITGHVAKVMILKRTKPIVEDWPKLYAYIKKTGAFELLQRRVSETAVEERWEAKKAVPGVGVFPVLKLSVTKK